MSALEKLEALPDFETTSATRRALFAALTTGALVGATSVSKAQAEGSKLNTAMLRNRLLRRISYGPIQEEIQEAKRLGYDAYLDSQLNYEAIDDSASEQAAAYYSAINFSVRDLFKVREDVAKEDLADATITRAVLSKRQLYQRMVEFWTDHFNVYYDKVGVLKVVHDRDVIRRFALGNFPRMLLANTMSPATLVYLDNDPSTRLAPNQNLARELMELHSIGVDGGYTQADVVNVARCLTGWSVRLWPEYVPDIGQFVFNKDNHFNGEKTVLNKTIAKGGWQTDGEKVVQILASNRNTGRFLGTKLCKFFLGMEPGPTLREYLADIYINTGGEIKPMVKAVLAQENLAASSLFMKRPFHFTMGLLRQTSAQAAYLGPIREALYTMGQHPFEWSPPNGYPTAQAYWSGGLLARWNFGFQLLAREIDNVRVDRNTLLKKATTLEDVLERINSLFFHGEMSTPMKNSLRLVLKSDTDAVGQTFKACSMAFASPGYQQC